MRDAVIDEIKSRVSILQLVQEYLPLKKAGTSWKGLCPFHSEKSPSFIVSEDRMTFHCFGCGEGGDIFTFLEKMEGYDFPETLKLLAERAGVKIERRDPRIAHERNLLAEIIDLAARYFRKVLTDSTSAEAARKYLESRQLRPETAQNFMIGFAPDSWEALSTFLASRGYKEDDLVRSGLSLRSVNGRGLYDRFRKRVMFSIRNTQGQVIGFTGRLLPEDQDKADVGGKYVNTPETPLYHKGAVLYGLDLAKQAIKKENLAVIVEGNMDVVSSHQAGITNVIAASGTALTDDQMRTLSRFTHRIAVAFDADAAGDTAARKGIVVALRNGFSVQVITIPKDAGKDPDDCVRKDPELWKKAIAESRDVVDHLIDRARHTCDLHTVDGKKAALALVLPVVAECGDEVARAHYLHVVSDAIGLPEEVVKNQLPKTRESKIETKLAVVQAPLTRHRMLSERLMALYLAKSEVRAAIQDGLKPEYLEGPDLRDLYAATLSGYTSVNSSPAQLDERTAELSAILPLMLDAMPSASPAQEVKDILAGLNDLHRKAGRERIETDMRDAERRGDTARIDELAKLFSEL